ncbi:hypothetical protein AB0I60_14735 [Actinosynnema sp. NPDC050436]|uniref:esterase/lipase family protein n=1 Tax=Actinosynnema sp. NPDC050436 TaxID=3155659 RepID=UPI0033DB3565
MADPDALPVSHDAVVVVPGILGSALYDTVQRRHIWGVDSLRWYWRAWTRGDGLHGLALDEDEREGRYGRVVPTKVIQAPAWAPVLGAVDPYTGLLATVRSVVADPAAVLEFAYDWRLPVEHNAALLAERMAGHLAAWRHNDAQLRARRRHPEGRPAQLVVIAHSMGGLLAQALALIPGATADVRSTITIGTPFYGSVRAALILGTGRGARPPLPPARLQAAARTMPGLHDLLPTYRCVHAPAGPAPLTPADVEAIGGDLALATESRAFHKRLDQRPLVGHHSVVGVAQKTAQGVVLRDGLVEAVTESFRYGPGGTVTVEEQAGDGTVHWESAALLKDHHRFAQAHGRLASMREVLSLVTDLVTRPGDRPRPLMGDEAVGLGIGVPDTAVVGTPVPVEVSRIDAQVTAFELTGDRPDDEVDVAEPDWEDGVPVARLSLPRPGLYRVEADGGSTSPVSHTVLVTEPAGAAG